MFILTKILLDVLLFVFGIGLIAYLVSAGAFSIVKKIVKSIIRFVRNLITGIINIFKGDEK